MEWNSGGQSGRTEKVSQEGEAICSDDRVPVEADDGAGIANEQSDDGFGVTELPGVWG